MSNLGFGVMMHILAGGSKHDPKEYYGQRIASAEIINNCLRLRLIPSEKTIEIWDNGQSCCEERYMMTDDDVKSLIGHELQRIEAKPGPDTEDEHGGCHEQMFVEIGTDKGFITIVNHNEHNGYYGGFGLTITEAETGT